MITQIQGTAPNTAAFNITGEVTKQNYDDVVYPIVDTMSKAHPELNLVLVVNTELKNFTAGAWYKDLLLGLKHFTQWKRVAMVNDTEFVKVSTAFLDIVTPAEFKSFPSNQQQVAIDWVDGKKQGY